MILTKHITAIWPLESWSIESQMAWPAQISFWSPRCNFARPAFQLVGVGLLVHLQLVGWLQWLLVGWKWTLGALALPLLCKSARHLCSYTASLDLDIVDTTEFLRIPGHLKNWSRPTRCDNAGFGHEDTLCSGWIGCSVSFVMGDFWQTWWGSGAFNNRPGAGRRFQQRHSLQNFHPETQEPHVTMKEAWGSTVGTRNQIDICS